MSRDKLKLLLTMALPVWGRFVVVAIGAGLVTNLVGLGEESGYAVLPGIYLIMGPPVGRLAYRVRALLFAALAIAAATALGAALSGSTAAVVAGLVVIGFTVGLLPRADPRGASLQLPVLTAFAYSAAFPLAEASAGSRVAAVLVATPIYVLAGAVLFQTDARRPLLRGAAAAFGELADAIEHALAGASGAAREAELGVVKFRVATGRLKEAALPLGEEVDSRAARLLTAAVQQAVTATELLVAEAAHLDAGRRERAGDLAGHAHGLAAGLARARPVPAAEPLDAVATAARSDADPADALLAQALADALRAAAVLHGESRELSRDRLTELPSPRERVRAALTPDDPIFRRAVRLAVAAGLAGLVAGLADLTRIYWAVFAAVVVLNAPAALGRRRAMMRIGGTVVGFVGAVALVELVGHHETLAFATALTILLPAMMLMPINYGAGVAFITCAVALLYSASGEEADFLQFRIVDNVVGVAVVCGVGLLLWRTSRDDWWRVAGLTAGSLANTVGLTDRAPLRTELMTRAIQLRTETVEATALPDNTPEFAAAWTYVAAAEDLIRALVMPGAGDDRAE
ncbi:MAG TPA: FUSC family protein, partial [Solirubrobacteraceae bacterium]